MRQTLRFGGAIVAWRASVVALLILFGAAGCTYPSVVTSLDPGAVADLQGGGPTLLLMPVDVSLSEMTAAGLQEPRADWTNAARIHMEKALDGFFDARDLKLVRYRPPSSDPRAKYEDEQMFKLHEQVGGSIMLHVFTGDHALPTKKKGLDWSLGPDAMRLGGDRSADYGLFIFIRDSYTTTGRAVVMGIAAILGVGLVGGGQIGFASLVDLRTGDVVWFRMLSRAWGDLRTAEKAGETIAELLKDFPA